ncbi:MAG: hypothetical protein ABIK36_19040 [Pseudomonadota bacterium]
MLARLPVVVAVMLALCSVVSAQTSRSIRDINSINGFDEMVNGFRETMAGALDRVPGKKPRGLSDAWSVAMETSFNSRDMVREMEAEVGPRLTPEEIGQLYEFFSSDLGLGISELEIDASGPELATIKATEGSAIYSGLASKDPERLALYNRLLDGVDAVGMGEALGLNVSYALVAGMVGAAKRPMSDEQIAALVKKSTINLRQAITDALNSSTAYVYRELSLVELGEYVAFLETPAARKYYELMMTALDRIMTKESRQFGNSIMVALGRRKA